MKIPLTQNKFALIDEADFAIVNLFKWCCHSLGYACSGSAHKGKKLILMHHLILPLELGKEVHHKNEDRLDNRRSNLELVTRGQHERFKAKRANCTSKHKGVSWHPKNKNWNAYLFARGSKIHLGCFDVEEDAAKARQISERYLDDTFGKDWR